jgi:hypothetical protein
MFQPGILDMPPLLTWIWLLGFALVVLNVAMLGTLIWLTWRTLKRP